MARENDLGFFASSSLVAMAKEGISHEFVESKLIKPVEMMKKQLQTAINYKNTAENKEGLNALQKCGEDLTKALYGQAAVAKKTEEQQEEPISRPSLRF